MRRLLSLSAVIAALVLAGAASAADGKPRQGERPVAATDGPMSTLAEDEAAFPEACWGGRYEKDEDLNDGSRISTEEILRIINPVQS